MTVTRALRMFIAIMLMSLTVPALLIGGWNLAAVPLVTGASLWPRQY